ncbi:hypothetical protein SYNPS1DRAFT_27343 [Syncephalis pseudoplumigaleata]|uniref:RGS domain-containing protein n=1 Tax=Syncephalis pseudoplumigaleata TaxID=1712513 RepID=A0A4P9Z3I9_9FUNG|nr:hypothetical protein SYNPS1DRAFT_27343 [Syncephalis pseudoplumigaleata]|eukprot:RKP26985.1 hypothetical protein SYNPS1DRAFT_27343 [Syncephalis pseudoplumigaleata]
MSDLSDNTREYNLPVLFYTFCGVLNSIYVLDLGIFLYISRTELPLQHRGRFLTCIHVLGSIIFSVATFVPLPYRSSFSCDAYYWLFSIGVTLWTTSLALKFWRLIWLYELNRGRLATEQEKQQQIRRLSLQHYDGNNGNNGGNGDNGDNHQPSASDRDEPSQSASTVASSRATPGSLPQNVPLPLSHALSVDLLREEEATARQQLFHPTHCGIQADVLALILDTPQKLCHRSREVQRPTALEDSQMHRLTRKLVAIKVLRPQYHVYVVAFILLVSVVFSIGIVLLSSNLSTSPGLPLSDCANEWPIFLPNIVMSFFFICIFPAIGAIIWYTTDAYGIRNEFIIQAIVGMLGMIIFLLLLYVEGDGWIRARHHFPPVIVPEIVRIVSHVMTVAWPVFYLLYERHLLERKRRRTSAELAELLSKSISSDENAFEVFLEALDNREFLRKVGKLDMSGAAIIATAKQSPSSSSSMPIRLSNRHPARSSEIARDNRPASPTQNEIEEVHAAEDTGSAQDAALLAQELVKLYREYIIPYSPNELNITCNCREALVQAYEQERLTFESFEPARYEILQLVFQNTWPRMLRSELR